MARELKNYMEICVADMIDDVLDSLKSCKCNECKLDIMAISLNAITPKYVVTKKGELYTKLAAIQQQFDVDIISEITKAADIVNKNPRHE